MKLTQAAIDFNQLFQQQKQNWSAGKISLGSGTTFGDIIKAILPYIFTAAGVALLVYLIIGGLSMMLSRGEPKALESAKTKITGALIGFIILFVSYWIVQIVGKLLGIEAINNIFK